MPLKLGTLCLVELIKQHYPLDLTNKVLANQYREFCQFREACREELEVLRVQIRRFSNTLNLHKNFVRLQPSDRFFEELCEMEDDIDHCIGTMDDGDAWKIYFEMLRNVVFLDHVSDNVFVFINEVEPYFSVIVPPPVPLTDHAMWVNAKFDALKNHYYKEKKRADDFAYTAKRIYEIQEQYVY